MKDKKAGGGDPSKHSGGDFLLPHHVDVAEHDPGSHRGLDVLARRVAEPGVVGVVVTVLSFAPFAGSAVISLILSFVGLLSFTDQRFALTPVATYLVSMFVANNIAAPCVLGSRLALSPVAIFISIIFWGSDVGRHRCAARACRCSPRSRSSRIARQPQAGLRVSIPVKCKSAGRPCGAVHGTHVH